MKNNCLRQIVLLCGILLLIFVALFWRPERDHPLLAYTGISVPISAITAYGKGDPFMQSGYEDIIAFRLPPNQIPALMKQIQIKEHQQIGLYPRYVSPRIFLTPYLAKFFAEVPKNTTSAHFWFFQHCDNEVESQCTEFIVDCSLAINKTTGRVWFYRRDIYS